MTFIVTTGLFQLFGPSAVLSFHQKLSIPYKQRLVHFRSMIKGFSKEYLAKKSLVYEKIIMKKVPTYVTW